MELRWYVERWEEYRDGLNIGAIHTEDSVLQWRPVTLVNCKGYAYLEYGDWKVVPTVYSDSV